MSAPRTVPEPSPSTGDEHPWNEKTKSWGLPSLKDTNPVLPARKPEPFTFPTILVREIQAYGRTLYKPASQEAHELISLCSGRANFNPEDLQTISDIGFPIEVLPTEWRIR